MSIGKALEYFINFYYQAKDNVWIRKPIAWALYQTWMVVNELEKSRNEVSE